MSTYKVPTLNTTKGNAAIFGASRALRLRNAVPKGVALWIRQSSGQQVRENIGSQLFQKGQLAFLKHFGIEPDGIQEYVTQYDASGRSAREGVDRPNFERLLEKIQEEKVGVVLVAFIDRHSRNKHDSERLYNALAAHRGIVVQQGNIYDPCNQTDRFFLDIQSLMAWFDNAQRSLRLLTSKASLAAALSLRVALPRGLCWASPDDPQYVRCADEAGFEHHITAEALRMHRVKSRTGGTEQYILPYPDAEVQRALRLTVEWTLETRSLREVVDRIRNHPAWPKPGHFPASRSRLFRTKNQDEPTPPEDLWQPLIDRPDGRDDLAPGVIRDWLRSPALCGIYSFDLPSLREKSPAAADAIGATTWEQNAFPALIDPELREQIEDILSNPLDSFVNSRYQGPRNHALPEVRCAAFLPNGEKCGLQCSNTYRSSRKSHRYVSAACTQRGHQGWIGAQIEEPVIEMVIEGYRDCELESALAHIRERRGVAEQSRQRIAREVRELNAQVESATGLLERAQRDEQHELIGHWEARLGKHLQRKSRLQRELVQHERQIERAGSLGDRDVARLRELAADIPQVVELAAKVEERFADREDEATRHEGLRRRVLAQLTRGVFARSLGYRCLDVQVEFPSGARRRRVVFVRAGRVPQAAAAFAALHMGNRAEPEERETLEADRAAREAGDAVACLYNAAVEGTRCSDDAEWDADRALTAALQHTHGSTEVKARPAAAKHESVQELADRLDLSTREILAAGLTGTLGPARIRGDHLVFRPTSAEIHAAFPAIARRWVAQKQDWDIDDTALIAEVRSDKGLTWKETQDQACRWSRIVRDRAGRRYTRRSCLPPEGQRKLMELLNGHLPNHVDRSTGTWLPLTAAIDELGVHRMTILKYRTDGATAVRPGRGYQGERSVYIWVDADFAHLCSEISR